MGSQRELQNAKLNELTNGQLALLIDEWVRNKRNREILKRRLIDGVCFEPLAEEFGLSVRQTKNIVYKSQDVLFRHIK
jgi:hypothetical protein